MIGSDTSAPDSDAGASPVRARALGYKHYLLGVLMIILMFNLVDRWALGIVLQDLKRDLHLTDTELGVLSGIAFALFYSVLGLPIARWADRGDRVLVISITAAIWSVCVALCGAATSFATLLLIRVGVGVGEAGAIPPAHSLIADFFDRDTRARAVSIYNLGGAASFAVGLFGAGWLNQFFGWRVTFFVLGLPGLALALIAWFTLKEPRRAAPPATPHADENLIGVCRFLWSLKTFRSLTACLAAIYFFGYGVAQWQPAFFIRSYGLTTGELGTWLAIAIGLGAGAGALLGGEWAHRFARGNESKQLTASAIAILGATIATFATFAVGNMVLSLVFVSLSVLATYFVNGPMFGTIQTLIPENMRATSVALIFLLSNLVGMGFGPLAVGALSDALAATLGPQSLRYALVIIAPGYLIAVWFAWRASRTVGEDMARLRLA
jgi:MFS family permease